MRVSFFNELDIFCEYKNLNTKEIIEGISTDPGSGVNIIIKLWLRWLLFAKRYKTTFS